MNSIARKYTTLISLLICTSSLGAEISDVFVLYKEGSYLKALNSLDHISPQTQKSRATKYYLKGLLENKLQKYDLSVLSFEKAIHLKNDSDDLFYQYGQALFANNDLEKSQIAFKKSYQKKYKPSISLYYIGHIFQLLEKHSRAKKIYQKVLREEKTDRSLMQVSRFQMSESMLEMVRDRPYEKSKKIVKKYILPEMEKAFETDKSTHVARDIHQRVKEVKKQYGLDSNVMKNGRTLPQRRWQISIKQDFQYDNNITQATDNPTSQATQKDSFIFNSTLQTNYKASVFNRLIIMPQLRLKKTKHSDDVNADVYQNDSYQLNSNLNSSFEHTLFNQMASFLFDIEYTYIARDPYQLKKMKKFAQTKGLSVGEKFKIFSYGESSLRFKYSDYTSYLDTLNTKTNSFIADQVIFTKKGNILLLLLQADFINNYNDQNSSSDLYLFRLDYLIPKFYRDYRLTLTYSQTFLDTKEQSQTRGTELTFSPAVKLSKQINKFLTFSLSHNYTKKTSDSTSYSYDKQLTTFEVEMRY